MSEHNSNGHAMAIARPSGNGIARQGFGGQEMERRDSQAIAMAERAKAEIQAHFIVAMQRPRDLDDVRIRLLKHCSRKLFAERAEYAKPVGGQKIVGPSIRFVETAIQEYGNAIAETTVVYEDDDKRVLRITVNDFERNVGYHDEAVIEKTVERSSPTGEVLGQRTNSQGKVTYRVRATEDDLANKQAAAVSKKIRNLGLRILPADLVDEAMEACRETRKAKIAQDPDAARKSIADAFAALGVSPEQIADYIGGPIAQAGPADLDELRVIYVTLKDGEARWADVMEAKRAERGQVDEPSKKATEAAATVKAKLEDAKNRKAKAATTAKDEEAKS
jgi:hypothetical protein